MSVAQAWQSIYGTPYDVTRLACTHFAAGWNAAKHQNGGQS